MVDPAGAQVVAATEPRVGARVITVVGLRRRRRCPAGAPERLAARRARHGRAPAPATRSTLPDGVRTVALRDDPAAALRAVADEPGDVVVLASGDPGFFGVVRAVRARGAAAAGRGAARADQRRAGVRPRRPGVGRRGRGVGARPRPARGARRRRAQPKVAVLTDERCGPAELGAALAGRDRPGARRRRAARPAGERVVEVTPDEAAARDVGGPERRAGRSSATAHARRRRRALAVAGHRGPHGWALPDDAFAHRDSMITKAEVRALVLARLGPRLGDLVWDVGAGSGSVGGRVRALRRRRARRRARRRRRAAGARQRRGARRRRAGRAGPRPDALADLPDPDAVFVGGGGPTSWRRAPPAGPRAWSSRSPTVERVAPTSTAPRMSRLRASTAVAAAGLAGCQPLARRRHRARRRPTPSSSSSGSPREPEQP